MRSHLEFKKRVLVLIECLLLGENLDLETHIYFCCFVHLFQQCLLCEQLGASETHFPIGHAPLKLCFEKEIVFNIIYIVREMNR